MVETKIGKYDVVKHLGSLDIEGEAVHYYSYLDQLEHQRQNPHAVFKPMPVDSMDIKKYDVRGKLDLGIRSVISFKDLMDADNNFSLSPEIASLRNKGFEFYRVVLIAGFSTEGILNFIDAKISLEIKSNLSVKQVNIHSISPKINSTQKITKTFAIQANANIIDVADAGGSYTDTRTYDELHPLIVPNYSAKQDAMWKFLTNDMVKEISGAQVIEFVVKQKKDLVSEWTIKPEGKLGYNGTGWMKKLQNRFKRDPKKPYVKTEVLKIPMDYD